MVISLLFAKENGMIHHVFSLEGDKCNDHNRIVWPRIWTERCSRWTRTPLRAATSSSLRPGSRRTAMSRSSSLKPSGPAPKPWSATTAAAQMKRHSGTNSPPSMGKRPEQMNHSSWTLRQRSNWRREHSGMISAAEIVRSLQKRGYRVVLATNPIFPRIGDRKTVLPLRLEPDDFALITTYENSNLVVLEPCLLS